MSLAEYNENSLSLYEKIRLKPTFQRVKDSLILVLLLLILSHRVFSYDNYDTLPWVVAFICEIWFTYTWALTFSTKWSPAFNKTYLDRLLKRVPENELPAVDLLVTTADPVLEPPIITVNTVLSLLALQYPTHKLACYVSDDGCSPHTLFALVEASKFAKIWVPFCKKYNVQVRAPFRYFLEESTAKESPEFQQEWLKMKDEYKHLCRKIENATQKWILSKCDAEYKDFINIEKQNHPAIIKIVWENKGPSDGVPHLIYISREKRPKHPHHYKAGAMNMLLKVSGLMTNAPFVLNVDCDMFVNNPNIALHAMCILLDSKSQNEVAFVQCPQQFNDTLKDDPLGNQMLNYFKFIGARIAGLQGPMYLGTNCFHRRKVIYGLSPRDIENDKKVESFKNDLLQRFGNSKVLVKSAIDAFEGKTYSSTPFLSESLVTATQVAGCKYEIGTGWGKQVGLLYGSTVEDILTGLAIHRRGWRSESCAPEPIAFTGCPPGDFPSTMSQQKRWAQGNTEILFSKHSPILAVLFGKLQFRMCLAYLWNNSWGLRSVPELCYAALPAFCIISNSSFLPKGHCLWIHAILVVGYNMHTLSEYIETGQSIREWWNNQRMQRIKTMNAWLFGFLTAILKLFGITETVFEVTQKGQSSDGEDASEGTYTFNESPMIVPGTTVLLLHLTGLGMCLLGLLPAAVWGKGFGLGEVLCSAYWVICYWPFFIGLFQSGKYGIPSSTIFKSTLIAFVFVSLCRNPITG